MMKKMYEEPQFEVERFLFENICDSSGLGDNNTGIGDGDFSGEDQIIPGI